MVWGGALQLWPLVFDSEHSDGKGQEPCWMAGEEECGEGGLRDHAALGGGSPLVPGLRHPGLCRGC